MIYSFSVTWDDAYQEVESDCEDIEVSEPYQEVSHKKKCLLSNPDADLDTDVLKDLELPPEKLPVELDGPVREKGTFGENTRTNDGSISAFSAAVNSLRDKNELAIKGMVPLF